MAAARAELSEEEARRFLALPEDFSLPDDDDALIADAKRVVEINLELGLELTNLSKQGLQLSPIWEQQDGQCHARLAVLPPVFRSRYFEAPGAEGWIRPPTFRMVAEVLPWMIDDPIGAAYALEDTHRAWYDAEAPTRPLEIPYRGHLRTLSLVLADLGRKGAAGFTTLEWLASIGLPFEESREDDDPTPEEIRASMKQGTRAMWSQEQGWIRAAFGG